MDLKILRRRFFVQPKKARKSEQLERIFGHNLLILNLLPAFRPRKISRQITHERIEIGQLFGAAKAFYVPKMGEVDLLDRRLQATDLGGQTVFF